MSTWKKHPLLGMSICAALLSAAPARADDGAALVELINRYRAAPGRCQGQVAVPAAPLAPHPALAKVRVTTGTMLQPALERAGYPAEWAEAISVSGAEDAKAAMAIIEQKYCAALLSPRFAAVGAARNGDAWQIVLAQPLPPRQLGDLQQAATRMLGAVNAARASARSCGDQEYGAAPPLRLNPALVSAAQEHSRDMATRHYFNHRGTDGSQVGERAYRAGYAWRRIGENIASGQESPEEAVAGWLLSPGHCANIMNHGFTEMGAAYAVNPDRERGAVYWTQVLATPR